MGGYPRAGAVVKHKGRPALKGGDCAGRQTRPITKGGFEAGAGHTVYRGLARTIMSQVFEESNTTR